MFASSVGITPIQALLKQLEFNTNGPIELIYSLSGYCLFGETIENIAMNNLMIQLERLVIY